MLMHIKFLGVKIAFLHGDTAKTLYVEQSPGFIKQKKPDLISKRKKGLYGPKSITRACHKNLKKMLLQSFKQGEADQCLHIRSRNGHLACMLSSVDDLIVETWRDQEFKEIIHHFR